MVSLSQDQSLEIRGFGKFSVRLRQSRYGRNPKTGQKIEIPAKKTIHFKLSKKFYEKINKDM